MQHTDRKCHTLKVRCFHFCFGTSVRSLWFSSYARSQAYLSKAAKLSWRNHVVQNLRAYIILHVTIIKWTTCVQEETEISSMSQWPRLSSTKISGSLSLATKMKQQLKLFAKIPGVAKSWHPVAQGWHLPPHGYGAGWIQTIGVIRLVYWFCFDV